MKITLHQPLAVSNKGKRANNEDCVYPKSGTTNPVEGLFLVCDGVGGSEKGEVASALACDLFAKYIGQHKQQDYNNDYFAKALDAVENGFDSHIASHPDTKGMATTLTLALFNNNGASLAHCGDSRIYHIRGSAICYQSRDHSYVNFLLETGEITEEEAANHPQRNMIMRAISGKKQRPTKLEVYETRNIEAGDYFFLCTDGVLESLTDEALLDILAAEASNSQKQQQIAALCEETSNDNYSFYLLQVQAVELTAGEQKEDTMPEIMATAPAKQETTLLEDEPKTPNQTSDAKQKAERPTADAPQKPKRKRSLLVTLLLLVLAALSIAAIVIFSPKKENTNQTTTPVETNKPDTTTQPKAPEHKRTKVKPNSPAKDTEFNNSQKLKPIDVPSKNSENATNSASTTTTPETNSGTPTSTSAATGTKTKPPKNQGNATSSASTTTTSETNSGTPTSTPAASETKTKPPKNQGNATSSASTTTTPETNSGTPTSTPAASETKTEETKADDKPKGETQNATTPKPPTAPKDTTKKGN